jgi:hypothetical protein
MARNVRWCCTAFENHYLDAGHRSIAVLVDRNSAGKAEFILQSRAFSKNEEPDALNIAVAMSRVTETGMNYCPWCGVPLDRWYRKQVDELVRPGLKIERGF